MSPPPPPGAFLAHNHSLTRYAWKDRSTPIGTSIDAYLRGQAEQEDHVIHLLFSANRWEAASSIISAIEAGTTVVIDRYIYSGIVYSAAKDNPSLTLDWARRPEVGLPRPDLCIFLDIGPDKAALRGGWGGEKYETTAMQARVRALFDEVIKGRDGEDVKVFDAGRGVEEVGGDIWKEVVEVMGTLQGELRTILS